MAGGLLVCSGGVQKGLEKVTKIMMVCLLALIVVLTVHSLTLSGAAKGIDFYLRPNMDTIRSVGIFNVITNAMNQAFFTLSLGIAAMEIFGSYMHDDHTLTGEAVRICALDTFVAIMAGLVIFPACFSYNVELDHGPALIFMTLPKIFLDMPGGRVWGSLFFLFMTFASFSTVTAVFENLIASACDNWGWSRKKSVGIVGAVLFLTSLPCVLGYNVWSGFHPMPGKDILDFEDFLVSSLLLPIGSLVYLLFCVSKRGWGFDKYLAECNKGTGIKMSPKFKVYFRCILPEILIIIILPGPSSGLCPCSGKGGNRMASSYYKPCPELDRCDELIEKYWDTEQYDKCFAGHLELAEKGYPLAECQVGYFYYRGLGVEKDLAKALYWTQRAAEHGDRDGQYNLATLYENGEGVEKNMDEAKHWYLLAAQQKHREAISKCRKFKIM